MPHYDATELLRLAVAMARARLREVMPRWGKLSQTELDNQVKKDLNDFFGGMQGAQWLRDHPDVFSDPDTVFHNRGGALAAGWKPPCVEVVEYKGKTLFLTPDHVRSLIA